MALINEHFLKLQNNYLFSDIAKKVNSFKVTHPKKKIIRMGIGDVTQPLARQTSATRFHIGDQHKRSVMVQHLGNSLIQFLPFFNGAASDTVRFRDRHEIRVLHDRIRITFVEEQLLPLTYHS